MTATRYDEIGGVGAKRCSRRPSGSGDDRRGRAVGDDRPVGRGPHGDGVGPLEVGLVEAGEETVGLERLEVRVEVLRAVLGIDEVVEAVAAAVVRVLVDDLDLGRRRPGGRRQHDPVPGPLRRDSMPVDDAAARSSPPRKSRKRSPSPVTGKRRRARPRYVVTARLEVQLEGVRTRPTRAARASASARARTSARAAPVRRRSARRRGRPAAAWGWT